MHLKTLGRTLSTLGSFWLGERKAVAWKWLALVIATLVIINVLNIGISYGERAVTSSLQAKDQALFWHNLIVYGLTLMTGTPIVGMLGWYKGKLHVNWRDYLSRSLLKKYFDNDRFLDINNDSRVTNPEQRIQQDANTVCDKLMTFVLALVDSFMALASFITILWLLSPTLVVTAVVYASIGTYISYKFGKRLIGLHFAQETLEADLRKVLIWAGKNATPIASYRGAARELDTVNERLRLTLSNWNQVLSWNRNLTLFKVGYDYLILIVPLVITAPLFFTGHMDMGGIVQAGTSFGRVLGALSVFVSQIMLFAELSAGAQRLVSFEDVLNQHHEGRIENGIKTEIAEGVLVRDLAVKTPDGNSTIIANVNFRVNPGQRILIVGPSGIGKSTILKALAGQIKIGSGVVARPTADDVMYLPQVPYMPPGTLRDQLLYPGRNKAPADRDLLELLNVLGLQDLVQREGGLDALQDWENGISGGQQQRIAIARALIARPKLLILDEATSGLDEENEALVYELISASGITTVSVAHREGVVKYSDIVLVIRKDGSSRLVTAAKYKWSQAA